MQERSHTYPLPAQSLTQLSAFLIDTCAWRLIVHTGHWAHSFLHTHMHPYPHVGTFICTLTRITLHTPMHKEPVHLGLIHVPRRGKKEHRIIVPRNPLPEGCPRGLAVRSRPSSLWAFLMQGVPPQAAAPASGLGRRCSRIMPPSGSSN